MNKNINDTTMSKNINDTTANNGFEEIGNEALESVAGGAYARAVFGAAKRGGKKLWKEAKGRFGI